MGFFEDFGDLLDPGGLFDFNNDGSHDFVEGVATAAVFNEILNDEESNEENDHFVSDYEEEDIFEDSVDEDNDEW